MKYNQNHTNKIKYVSMHSNWFLNKTIKCKINNCLKNFTTCLKLNNKLNLHVKLKTRCNRKKYLKKHLLRWLKQNIYILSNLSPRLLKYRHYFKKNCKSLM